MFAISFAKPFAVASESIRSVYFTTFLVEIWWLRLTSDFQKTTKELEIEGSRSQQTSVTGEGTETQKNMFWELSYPEEEELPNSDNFVNPRLPGLLSFRKRLFGGVSELAFAFAAASASSLRPRCTHRQVGDRVSKWGPHESVTGKTSEMQQGSHALQRQTSYGS